MLYDGKLSVYILDPASICLDAILATVSPLTSPTVTAYYGEYWDLDDGMLLQPRGLASWS